MSPQATEQDIQLLRQDIRAKKQELITQNLPLTESEATKFWPIYRHYTADLIEINNEKFRLIKDLIDLQSSRPNGQQQSVPLESGLHAISRLANEICGECVPRTYAPALKQWMDQIQDLARKIA